MSQGRGTPFQAGVKEWIDRITGATPVAIIRSIWPVIAR